MNYIIEELAKGVWTPVDQFRSKELAEASLGIKRALQLDGMRLYEDLRIVETSKPD